MKLQRILFGVIASALVLSVVACGDDDDAEEPTDETEAYFDMAADYESWETLGDGDLMASGDHGGDFVRTYANASAMDTISDEDYPFAAGALLVKEQYSSEDDDSPSVLSIMGKESDDDGDWYWMQADTDWEVHGGVQGSDVGMCVDCHAAAAGTDQVFVEAYGIDMGNGNNGNGE